MGACFSFGDNRDGQLGDGSTTARHSPVEIASLGSDNAQVAAGESHSLILKADGRVLAFGKNDSGQLGDGSTTNRSSPVKHHPAKHRVLSEAAQALQAEAARAQLAARNAEERSVARVRQVASTPCSTSCKRSGCAR